MKVDFKVTGQDKILTTLGKLPAAVKKGVRRAVEKGVTILLQAVKSELTRKRTGLLSKSLGKVVKSYPSGVTVGVVGPRAGFRTSLESIQRKGRRLTLVGKNRRGAIKLHAAGGLTPVRIKGKQAGQRVVLDPAIYAHLVEGGHKKGKGRSSAPAYPFVGPGFRKSAAAVQAAIQAELALRRIIADA